MDIPALILENADPRYRDMIAGFVSDKRNWVIPAYGIRKRRIDLTAAKVEEELQIKGDFVYADFNSTGVAEVSLNSPSEDKFPLLALSGVQDLPYEKVYITSSAQAGLFINLWYGYRSRFISPTSAIATIGSITEAVKIKDSNGSAVHATFPPLLVNSTRGVLYARDIGFAYGAAFASTTALAANTPGNIIAAASNLNGYLLHTAGRLSTVAQAAVFIAKATAPATIIDGDVLTARFMTNPGVGNGPSELGTPQQVFVAAGKRLDDIVTALEAAPVLRRALYTIF